MAKIEHYYTKFEDSCYYHVYNRSINKESLFRTEDNYHYFLKQFKKYLFPFVQTYAYCLLGNHFHFLIKINSDLTTIKELSNLTTEKTTHEIVSHQFRKFFQSYAMAFNKQQCRMGTLFQTPFKRVHVHDESYFTQLIYYINSNPQHHHIVSDFRDWKWSFYQSILAEDSNIISVPEVLEWFGGKQLFIEYHHEIHEFLNEDKVMTEDIDD